MTDHVNTSNNAAPKRPPVRETVSRKAREAQESAKASATLATHTAKHATTSATAKATEFVNAVTEKLPFEVPKVELGNIELPKVELPKVDVSAHVAKVTEKSTQLASDAKKTVESTVTLVREAVGK